MSLSSGLAGARVRWACGTPLSAAERRLGYPSRQPTRGLAPKGPGDAYIAADRHPEDARQQPEASPPSPPSPPVVPRSAHGASAHCWALQLPQLHPPRNRLELLLLLLLPLHAQRPTWLLKRADTPRSVWPRRLDAGYAWAGLRPSCQHPHPMVAPVRHACQAGRRRRPPMALAAAAAHSLRGS